MTSEQSQDPPSSIQQGDIKKCHTPKLKFTTAYLDRFLHKGTSSNRTMRSIVPKKAGCDKEENAASPRSKSGVKALLGSWERRASTDSRTTTASVIAAAEAGSDRNQNRNENNQNLHNTNKTNIMDPHRPRSVVIERFARSQSSATSSSSSDEGEIPASDTLENPSVSSKPAKVQINQLRKNYEHQIRQNASSSCELQQRVSVHSRYAIHQAEPASDSAFPPPFYSANRRSTGSVVDRYPLHQPPPHTKAKKSPTIPSKHYEDQIQTESNQRTKMLRKSFEKPSVQPFYIQTQPRGSNYIVKRLPSTLETSNKDSSGKTSIDEAPASPDQKKGYETPASPNASEHTTHSATTTATSEEEEDTLLTANLLTSPSLTSNSSDPMSQLHMDEMSVMALRIKPPNLSSLGISFRRLSKTPDCWRILISNILPSPGGMLSKSELKVGQTLLAVNGIPANDFTSIEEIETMLNNARKIAIVATKSILVTVARQSLDELIGLSLIQAPCHHDQYLDQNTINTVIISKICEKGLIATNKTTGVLQVGMKIIAINGQADLSLSNAKRMLRETVGKLSILAVEDEFAMKAIQMQGMEEAMTAICTNPTSEAISPPQQSLNLYLEESSAIGMAIKPTRDSRLGIGFVKRLVDGRMLITDIFPDSLLAKSELRVGQTLLAVNGIPASEFSAAKDVVALIQRTKEVAIVATKSILASVEKPSTDTRVGIAFCQSRRDGILSIHKIAPDGLFGQNGLLDIGMKVVAINDQPCPGNLKVANAIVKKCVGTLTILAVNDDENEADTI